MDTYRERLTEGLDGPLCAGILRLTSPEEHRANMHCRVNNSKGGLSQEAIEYIQERKVKRGH